MKGWRLGLLVLGSLAAIFIFASVTLFELPVQPGRYSLCLVRCSSFLKVDDQREYALHDSFDLQSPELYLRPWPALPLWKRAEQAPILRVWKQSGDQNELRVSADAARLFVLHDNLLVEGHQIVFTDAIDITTEEPRLLIGGGICCGQEDVARLVANQSELRALADALGLAGAGSKN